MKCWAGEKHWTLSGPLCLREMGLVERIYIEVIWEQKGIWLMQSSEGLSPGWEKSSLAIKQRDELFCVMFPSFISKLSNENDPEPMSCFLSLQGSTHLFFRFTAIAAAAACSCWILVGDYSLTVYVRCKQFKNKSQRQFMLQQFISLFTCTLLCLHFELAFTNKKQSAFKWRCKLY